MRADVRYTLRHFGVCSSSARGGGESVKNNVFAQVGARFRLLNGWIAARVLFTSS